MTVNAESRLVLMLDHDFNNGRNEAGFHEVTLPGHIEASVRTGDVVIIGDSDYRTRGRVRCLIAVVEEEPR